MNISQEARQRKELSETILKAQGVPYIQHLPAIGTEKEAKRRSSDEIAFRALALLVIAMKGEGLEQPKVEKIIKDYNLEPYFTPKELAFLNNLSPSEHERIQFIWRYEAAWVMLWALSYIDKLEAPVAICNVPQAVTFMKNRTTEQFLANAKLRPLSEILDQADLIYRYDWAAVNARINENELPANLDSGVIYERHYALNWLIGYSNQEWDDISTDT